MHKFRNVVQGGIASLGALSGAAMAAVPAEVLAETTNMKADAIALATIFLVVVVALATFAYMKRGAK